MSEIKLSGMNKLTTTFGPFSLVRPCKVLLTLLPGFLEAICCSFLPCFLAWAKPQLQWSGERGEDAITVSAPHMKNIF